MSLREARQKRDAIRVQLAEGTDPNVQKRLDEIEAETKARTTFLLVPEEYLKQAEDRELAEITLKKKQWHVHTLEEALHDRPIAEITLAE